MKLFAVLLFVVLFGCQEIIDTEEPEKQVTIQLPQFHNTTRSKIESFEVTEMKESSPEYLMISSVLPSALDSNIFSGIKNYNVKPGDIIAFVDTTQTIIISTRSFFPIEPLEGETLTNYSVSKKSKDNQKVQEFSQAYPLYLVNNGIDSVAIPVQDDMLIQIMEAIDSNGKWLPIEYWDFNWCGNAYQTYYLRNNECIVSPFVRYQGKYKTRMRVKIKLGDTTIYSNDFEGSINPVQFNLPNDFQNTKMGRRSDSAKYAKKVFLITP